MRGRYFFYIAQQYAKNLLMMLVAITGTVTLVDYLHDAARLSGAGNQTILYLFYTWQFRLAQFYPLAIAFAAIVTYMSLVRANLFVSLYGFGYTKRQLLIPFVLPAWILYLLMLLLQSGEFAYAKERAWAIAHHVQSVRVAEDLFFKYNDAFVYVKHLDPIRKVLSEVTVFETNGTDVVNAVILERALFDGEYWVADDALMMRKRYNAQHHLQGFTREHTGRYRFLKGYRPKVIELIYEGDSLSLLDALHTYSVLEKQGLDTVKIKASLYSRAVLPLFALAMMMILFLKSSYHSRYMNPERVWLLYLGGTLSVWGILYALYSLSSGGVLSAEIAIVLPVLLLLGYAFSLYVRAREKLA